MRLPLPRRRLGLLALLPAVSAAQQPGPWQGGWVVLREDPRQRGAALPLLRLDITQQSDVDAPEILWAAERAICPDPHGNPCGWAGAQGAAREVVADQQQLSCLFDILAEPFRLVLTRGDSEWIMGRLFPGQGAISYAVAARRRPD